MRCRPFAAWRPFQGLLGGCFVQIIEASRLKSGPRSGCRSRRPPAAVNQSHGRQLPVMAEYTFDRAGFAVVHLSFNRMARRSFSNLQ
jgi:hypothetical protein